MADQTVVFGDDGEDLDRDEVPTEVEMAIAARSPQRTARAALNMATAGATNAEIAELLHYDSPATARAAWEGELAAAYEHETDYDAFRRMQSARMNRGLKTIAVRAFSPTLKVPDPKRPGKTMEVPNDDQLSWLREWRSYVESLSRLHGLEAAKVMAIVTPDAKQLELVVSTVANAINKGEEIEGDIFGEREDDGSEDIEDAEIVE